MEVVTRELTPEVVSQTVPRVEKNLPCGRTLEIDHHSLIEEKTVRSFPRLITPQSVTSWIDARMSLRYLLKTMGDEKIHYATPVQFCGDLCICGRGKCSLSCLENQRKELEILNLFLSGFCQCGPGPLERISPSERMEVVDALSPGDAKTFRVRTVFLPERSPPLLYRICREKCRGDCISLPGVTVKKVFLPLASGSLRHSLLGAFPQPSLPGQNNILRFSLLSQEDFTLCNIFYQCRGLETAVEIRRLSPPEGFSYADHTYDASSGTFLLLSSSPSALTLQRYERDTFLLLGSATFQRGEGGCQIVTDSAGYIFILKIGKADGSLLFLLAPSMEYCREWKLSELLSLPREYNYMELETCARGEVYVVAVSGPAIEKIESGEVDGVLYPRAQCWRLRTRR